MPEDRFFSPPPEKLKLRAYIFKYPKQFWIQASGGIIYNTVIVFGSIYLGKTIDAASLVLQGKAALSLFYMNLFLFLGFTLVFQLARFFKRYFMREIINLMKCDIRTGLLSSLLKKPLAKLSSEKVGDMMSRMVGDVELVGQSVQTTITEMWDTVLLMFSYFVACLFYSTKITLLAAIPIPIAIVSAEFIRHNLYTLSQKARKAASNINVHLQHNVSGISLLRLFGLEETDRLRFSSLLEEQLKWNVKAAALQNGMLPLYILIACSGAIVVVGMGGENVVHGTWTTGVFTAYLAMYTAMAVRTNVAAKVMNTWHSAKASWDRICEKMDVGNGEEALPMEGSMNRTNHALDVHALSFTYAFSGEASLRNISFTAKPGEIIGITGPIGSGKSALAAALSGLYPYGGDICVYGVPLCDLHMDRSKMIAYMDADHFIFSDDIAFNITLDRAGGDLRKAMQIAAIQEDVEQFPDGIHTRLMERGVRISGGQRQRLSLARAIYSDAKLLILDDPFSAVDIAMERQMMRAIREQLSDKVIILFSHRLATFNMADRIIVLNKGEMIESGTHDELIKADGLYRDIYEAQAFVGGENE